MADLTHVVPNRLARRAAWWRWGSRGLVLTGLAAAAVAFSPLAMVLAIPAWHLTRRLGALARSGAEGEASALEALRKLPDDHIVFNQVRIPCPQAREGFLEADFVVVAPQRLAVIEVKNNRGFIHLSVADPLWKVEKPLGNDTMRSPVLQVLRHAAVLGTWLREHGARGVWVEPAVYFSHPKASFSYQKATTAVSLVASGDLPAYFAHLQANDRSFDRAAVVKTLLALREWDVRRQQGFPEPEPPHPEPETVFRPRNEKKQVAGRGRSVRPQIPSPRTPQRGHNL